jgi:hypothetical protein
VPDTLENNKHSNIMGLENLKSDGKNTIKESRKVKNIKFFNMNDIAI